ncbi:MAG: IPT/TIG domain-containing protein [Acidobacteriia bacterium]|nr:IPT/TIG domain-containing protein [Terriglobia bacterium]
MHLRNLHSKSHRWTRVTCIAFACLAWAVLTPAQTQNTVYFADIVHGGSGSPFQTILQLFNASDQGVTGTLSIFQDNGAPFNLGLKDSQTGNALTPTSPGVFSVSIPARGVKAVVTTGSQSVQAGWVQVTSTSSKLNGNVVFQQLDSVGNLLSQTGVGNSPAISSLTGFLEKSSTVNTGIALANPSSTATVQVTLQVTGPDGLVTLSPFTFSLAPLQHIAQFLEQFPPFANVGGTVGTLAVSASGNIIGTFLRQDRGQLTTVPLFAGTALVPTILSISPTSGSTDTTVTITGASFDTNNIASNHVTFNGVNALVVSGTATTLVVTVPPGLPAQTVPVVVTANGGSSNSVNFTATAGFAVPVINSLDPPAVLAGSDTTNVTINGANFGTVQEGAAVRFGASATTFTNPALQVVSSTKAIMTLTSDLLGQVGSFFVTFVNPRNSLFNDNLSNPMSFQVSNQIATQPPTITSVDPTSAHVGERVTIAGTNFDPINTSNNIVRFNGVQAASLLSATGTQIAVAVPGGATTGPLTVTTSGLTSNAVNFTVLLPLALRTIPVGAAPAKVAIDPVLNQALVTDSNPGSISSGATNAVTFVDIASASVLTTISVAAENPLGIAIFGRQAFVANFPGLTPTRNLSVLNLDARTFQALIDVSSLGGRPFNLAVDSANGNAVITDNSLHVGVLNFATGQTVSFLVSTPYDVAIYNPSPTVDWALISDFSEGKLVIFDLLTQTQKTTIAVGRSPQGIAVNPGTGLAVVANSGDNTVSIVNLNTLTVVGTVTVGSSPNYAAVDTTRNRAVVTNNLDGSISVIDLTSKAVTATLSTGGNNPTGVAISPNANLALVTNQGSGTLAFIALP